jgi:hypothetical protein
MMDVTCFRLLYTVPYLHSHSLSAHQTVSLYNGGCHSRYSLPAVDKLIIFDNQYIRQNKKYGG